MTQRVAVLGVPRGYTSVVVGMFRILGLQLPPGKGQECLPGESARLRNGGMMERADREEMLSHVMALPDWTVWKDPTVGGYTSDLMSDVLPSLDGWTVVAVTRDPVDVADSEIRRCADWGPADRRRLEIRARGWQENIDRLRLAHGGWSIPGDALIRRPSPFLDLFGEILGTEVSPYMKVLANEFIGSGTYTCPRPGLCNEHRGK